MFVKLLLLQFRAIGPVIILHNLTPLLFYVSFILNFLNHDNDDFTVYLIDKILLSLYLQYLQGLEKKTTNIHTPLDNQSSQQSFHLIFMTH